MLQKSHPYKKTTLFSLYLLTYTNNFIFIPPRYRPAGGIERSGCPYVHTCVDQVNIFVQGRISRPINGSKLIFHMWMYLYETSRNIQEPRPIFHGPLTSDFGQIIKVKIFVQGRILSSTNRSKLIFYIRMYLYETSRNIQEPWPHDLYFTVCLLQTLANFPWLRFLSSVDF